MTNSIQDVLDDVEACDTHEALQELADEDPRVHLLENGLVAIHPNQGGTSR